MNSLDNSTHEIAQKLYYSIRRRLGFVLTIPNYALYAAALDPQVMLHEIIPAELNNKVWSSLEECVMEYAELVEVAPSSDLCPIFSNLSIEDVHLVCHSYRLLFENVAKRERLLTQDPL